MRGKSSTAFVVLLHSAPCLTAFLSSMALTRSTGENDIDTHIGVYSLTGNKW